jgi:DNA mismatch endonuclease, patch repair protein
MTDVFSKDKRSELMGRVRSKNTKPEIALRKLVSSHFYPLGLRYRLHGKSLLGSPDIVFVSRRVAIFVDGGFWHGYRFKNWAHKIDRKYWLPKIKENMQRDRRVNRRLRMQGWTVIRIWDHEIKRNPENVLSRIRIALRA